MPDPSSSQPQYEQPPSGESAVGGTEDSGDEQSRGGGSTLPPFTVGQFKRQLWTDAALRTALLAAVVAAGAAVFIFDTGSGLSSTVLILAVLVGWLAVSAISARVSRRLPAITAMIDADPQAAESALAEDLDRRPLLRWVRLMLYCRLALLRHRQHRYGESAAISQTVLAYPLGPAAKAKPHLLLMLAEARLQISDPATAFFPLLELYRTRLSLAEAIQRLALQTRYEVMTGRPDAALTRTTQKIEMVELMPASQCGAMHALLAVAAEQTDRPALADWLWQRATLLLGSRAMDQLAKSEFPLITSSASGLMQTMEPAHPY